MLIILLIQLISTMQLISCLLISTTPVDLLFHLKESELSFLMASLSFKPENVVSTISRLFKFPAFDFQKYYDSVIEDDLGISVLQLLHEDPLARAFLYSFQKLSINPKLAEFVLSKPHLPVNLYNSNNNQASFWEQLSKPKCHKSILRLFIPYMATEYQLTRIRDFSWLEYYLQQRLECADLLKIIDIFGKSMCLPILRSLLKISRSCRTCQKSLINYFLTESPVFAHVKYKLKILVLELALVEEFILDHQYNNQNKNNFINIYKCLKFTSRMELDYTNPPSPLVIDYLLGLAKHADSILGWTTCLSLLTIIHQKHRSKPTADILEYLFSTMPKTHTIPPIFIAFLNLLDIADNESLSPVLLKLLEKYPDHQKPILFQTFAKKRLAYLQNYGFKVASAEVNSKRGDRHLQAFNLGPLYLRIPAPLNALFDETIVNREKLSSNRYTDYLISRADKDLKSLASYYDSDKNCLKPNTQPYISLFAAIPYLILKSQKLPRPIFFPNIEYKNWREWFHMYFLKNVCPNDRSYLAFPTILSLLENNPIWQYFSFAELIKLVTC